MAPFPIVVDLGFGDAGKGGMVAALVERQNASAVIRYTGGPHAAHHLVSADGTSHAFCQFGASFRPGLRTHLARSVIVKPENLLYEARLLQNKGLPHPLRGVTIDPSCRVVTSYHAMLCQMKETQRGARHHGTVGIGAGEAAYDSERDPNGALRVADLYRPQTLAAKLAGHIAEKCRQAQTLLDECTGRGMRAELMDTYQAFTSQVHLEDLLECYGVFCQALPAACCPDEERFDQLRRLPGGVVFEGAHGALLDYTYGYYPYVVKNDTTIQPALRILTEAGAAQQAEALGVVRALGYRHGPGPFVTEDPALAGGLFPELHNHANEWQGALRYGWFDLLAIAHGLSLNPQVQALALTMTDHLRRLERFQVCCAYEYRGSQHELLDRYFRWQRQPDGGIRIGAIKKTPTGRSPELAGLLADCVPAEWLYFEGGQACPDRPGELPAGAWDFIDFLESDAGLGLPVRYLSLGPTLADKVEL